MDKTNEQIIWDFLLSNIGNAYGVAGLMGNLYAESGLNPKNLQNSFNKKLNITDDEYTLLVDGDNYPDFVNDKAGYGLAQWTYCTRKKRLKEFAKNTGRSIGDLGMQLEFLIKEIKGYSSVWKALTTAKSVKDASDSVLTQYERPADMSDSVKEKRAGYGNAYYIKYVNKKESEVSCSMKNTELVAKLIDIANNYKTLYVMGCFGAPMTDSNKKRYCSNHEYNKQDSRVAMIKSASADTFGFDCVCLIKGVLWGWNGDKKATYGGATYASNNVPDVSADGMIEKCLNVSTNFSNIEVGEAVWLKGHIGVYIGNGLAVECTPAFDNKVQITAVKNIGTKSGYNSRTWTKHGKLPYITYEKVDPIPQPDPDKSIDEIAKEVISGKWGNGEDRKNRLTEAGYDYSAVQAKVNELVGETPQPAKKTVAEIAQEVLSGKWGNGVERKEKLTAAGYDYSAVQAKVNELVNGKTDITPKKSVSEIAKEVIKGDWGNGADRKNRLTAAGYNYAVIQAEVNKQLNK